MNTVASVVLVGLTSSRSRIEADRITYDMLLAVMWRYKDGVSSDAQNRWNAPCTA
jgi:hypothetical protein